MPNLIKIGERIINLNTIAFVEREDRDGMELVTIYYERGRTIRRPLDRPNAAGTVEDPVITPLNMSFTGNNARYVWEKLTALSETWGLPGEIEPNSGGGWPKRRQ